MYCTKERSFQIIFLKDLNWLIHSIFVSRHAIGDPLNSPGMGLCRSKVSQEESPGTETSTNVTTVASVLKRDHLPSKSVDIPAPGEEGVIGAVPQPNPLARAREKKQGFCRRPATALCLPNRSSGRGQWRRKRSSMQLRKTAFAVNVFTSLCCAIFAEAAGAIRPN